MKSVKYSIIVNMENDPEIAGKINVSIGFPAKQDNLTVNEATHMLVAGVSLLIKSSNQLNDGKDYKLMEEVIEHLNSEFASVKAFKDAYINKQMIKNG